MLYLLVFIINSLVCLVNTKKSKEPRDVYNYMALFSAIVAGMMLQLVIIELKT